MHSFKCLINKTYKKVSYPNVVSIEPLNHSNILPVSLITNEIKSGEILMIEFIDNTPIRIFVNNKNKMHQIFGTPINYDFSIELECINYEKKIRIEKFIHDIFINLSLNELIVNKNDLEDLENELTKYLLVVKRKDRIETRKIRSIVFKNCKSSNFAEKMCEMLKKEKFDYFERNFALVKMDFPSLTVQITNEP